MRLMDWNIEHMNSWWEGGDADPAVMRASFAGNNFSPAISDVPALAARVGNVITAVAPDVMTIQEGPGLPELRDFFTRFVDLGNWTFERGSGGGQALIVAAREGGAVTAMEVGPSVVGGIDLAEEIQADVDADMELEGQAFARRPLVVKITAHGHEITIVNNHLKSKFVADGEARFNAGGDERLSFFRDALVVRRRISAEAYRIREYLDATFEADPAARVIVTGDLNDGPGADYFEANFLTHSVVDRVFGSVFSPERQLAHVLFHGDSTDFTAQFYDFIADETKDLVLDHVGLSPELDENWTWEGRVAVQEYTDQIVTGAGLEERDKLPSDHRPVVVDLTPN